jgi:hypothetical protein
VKVLAAPARESNGINVRLVPGGVTLRGRFVSPSNAPARAAPLLILRSPVVLVTPQVLAQNLDSMNSKETETPFEIRGVQPGSYYLYAVTLHDAIAGPSGCVHQSTWLRKT